MIFTGQEFNGASRVRGSAQPPAKKTAGQIEKETLKNRISNDEWRRLESLLSIFLDKIDRIPSFDTCSPLENSIFNIRYSAVRYSTTRSFI